MSDKKMLTDKVYLKTLNQNVMLIDQFNADGIDYVTVKLDNGAVLIAQLSEITDMNDSSTQKQISSTVKSVTIALPNGEIVDREIEGNFLIGEMITDSKTGYQVKVLRINN